MLNGSISAITNTMARPGSAAIGIPIPVSPNGCHTPVTVPEMYRYPPNGSRMAISAVGMNSPIDCLCARFAPERARAPSAPGSVSAACMPCGVCGSSPAGVASTSGVGLVRNSAIPCMSRMPIR